MFIIQNLCPNVNTFFKVFLFSFYFVACVKSSFAILRAETIDFIAKLAGYLTIFLFFRHLAKFGFPMLIRARSTFHGCTHSGSRFHWSAENLYSKPSSTARMMSSRLIPLSSIAVMLQLCQIGLQLVNVGILHARHKLHEPAHGALDRAVGIPSTPARTPTGSARSPRNSGSGPRQSRR